MGDTTKLMQLPKTERHFFLQLPRAGGIDVSEAPSPASRASSRLVLPSPRKWEAGNDTARSGSHSGAVSPKHSRTSSTAPQVFDQYSIIESIKTAGGEAGNGTAKALKIFEGMRIPVSGPISP